jgi:general secretion pathway protein K
MGRQRGFVLATTVWMVAVIFALGGLFYSYVQVQVEQAFRLQEHMRSTLDVASTEQTLRYLLLTRHQTYAGLTTRAPSPEELVVADAFVSRRPFGDEIRVDGTEYQGLGCVRFRIQDRSGRIGTNARGTDVLLGERLDLPLSGSDLRTLSATLADYIDADDERRVGSAERNEYLRQNLVPPTNHYLRSDKELELVYGWQRWLAANPGWRQWMDIGYDSSVNVNSAPAELLAVLLGISPAEASLLTTVRMSSPFSSLNEVAGALKRLNRWQKERFRFYAGHGFRLELWCDDSVYTTVLGVQLTPQDLNGPAQTDYVYRETRIGSSQPGRKALQAPGRLFTDALPANG